MTFAAPQGFFEPQPRTVIDWDPASINSAETEADSGSIRGAADLTERLLIDDRVKGVLAARTSLIRLPRVFEPSDRSSAAQRAAEAAEEGDFDDMLPPRELARLHGMGIVLNLGLGQLKWLDDSGKPRRIRGRNVPRLEVWHSRYLRFDYGDRTWRLLVDDGIQEIKLETDSGQWILYSPSGKSRPWAHGCWRVIKLWWLLKQYAANDWARYGEKHGTGAAVAEAPEGATDDQRKALAKELKKFGREKAFALPAGWKLSLIEAKANTWETYKAQIEMANMGIAIAIAGQNLTSEVQGGSYAAATVHKYVAAQIVGADAEALSDELRSQVLRPWAQANFGNAELAPWPIWDTQPPEDDKAKVEVLRTFGEALLNLLDTGIPVDVEKLAEDLNIPLLKRRRRGQRTTGHAEDLSEGSGFEAQLREGNGFLSGQIYVDSIGDRARLRAGRAMRRDVNRVQRIIREAGSYQEMRASLLDYYRDQMNPDALNQVLERAIIMSQLGGALAVRQDVPEAQEQQEPPEAEEE